MRQLYAPLNSQILFTDIKSAELIKHASNAFLATKISFINAIANICEKTGANVKLVAEGMGLDKRIGKAFLNAGLGYGGFCFPKDTEAFIHISEKLGYDFSLLKEVQAINDMQNELFAGRIIRELAGKKNPVVAVLGLAFKPNTDDLRFAKSLEIIKRLQKAGIGIKAFDPVAMENAKKVLSGTTLCNSAIDCLNGTDAIVLVTEWPEFLELDFKKAKSIMTGKLVFDGRNFLNKQELEKLGFKYFGIGV
jgi:UDPglucose 6-dehydrogenase